MPEPKPWPIHTSLKDAGSGPMYRPLFLELPLRWASLVRQAVLPCRFTGVLPYLSRLALITILLPVFGLFQLAHFIGLSLDRCLFPRFVKLDIKRPLFILGVPRSGTTHTHHIIAHDERFTTLSLWELLFAPSICERYFFYAVGKLDSYLGAPMHRLLHLAERRIGSAMKDIHPLGLTSPEEDFLLLLPTLDCFLLVLLFPESEWLWQLAQADRGEYKQHKAVMRRYRRMLQRHLYFHGEHLQLLSKNASFAGMSRALVAEFPDCAIVVCERDAVLAAQSQFRSLADVRKLLATDAHYPLFQQKLLDTLEFYYLNLQRLKLIAPENRLFCVSLHNLSRQPRKLMQSMYQELHLGDVSYLHELLTKLESKPPIQPQTTSRRNSETDSMAVEFRRFHRWRHSVEKRL